MEYPFSLDSPAPSFLRPTELARRPPLIAALPLSLSLSPRQHSNSKLSHRWTNEEHLIAVQAFKKYGKNFKEIAELIGNKNEAHIKSFYLNFERRYGLDKVIKEFESEQEEYQKSSA